MAINVIGRFEVTVDQEPQKVVGNLQRLLLALLILRAPQWTSPDVLSEALWPDSSAGAESRLHLHIHRLRARLGTGTIESGPDGYRLDAPHDTVDVWRFERAVGDVLADHFRGRADTELLRRLEDAVQLWVGAPFPGVEHPDVTAERYRLEEMYLLAQETRFAHLLDRGEHEAVLEVLAPVASEHRTRESLQTLWMTALHRAGRRSEAIEVFDAAREALAVLDLEPDRELLAARAMVLEQPAAQRGGTARDAAPSVELDEGEIRRDLAQPGAPELTLRARRRLARVLAMKGRFDEALELFGQIEAQYRARSQEDDEATALGDLAAVVSVTGDLSRALRYLDEAEQLEERTTSTDAFLRLLRALLLTHSGRIEQAAEILREVPRPPDEPVPSSSEPAAQLAAMWWRVRSQVDRRRGATGPAVAAARRAFHLAARREPQLDPGPMLVELASSLRDAGDEECFEWFHRAIQDAHHAGRLPMAACAHAALAKAQLLWGEPENALLHGREALSIARRTGCWGYAGRAAKRIADAAVALSDPMRAAWYYCEALSFYRRVEYPLLPQVRVELEQLVASSCGFLEATSLHGMDRRLPPLQS
ncbi:MAG TPA: tetratricopeptide repeat protein [Candidatus Brachybacterium merdavium]|uniref:Tetratricopeptide repeat protein n=1 Tax=Candidatus Brachybacterium merdavium TaxID=2838513 RepID=A0A9D2LDA2_9MICO|nr:tetratricopeptide repeat protein [Candidatus Brachybacterium merdavium]